MMFQVIDYAEKKLPLFLSLHQLDPTDLHCQRAWISEALALHHKGFSLIGGETHEHGEPSWKCSFMARNSLSSSFCTPHLFLLLFLFLVGSLAHTAASKRICNERLPIAQTLLSGNCSVKNSFLNFTNKMIIAKILSFYFILFIT